MFGITQGIEKNGDYLYLADGSVGIRTLHLTSPVAVESISVYNTPGVAKDVKFDDDLLFVADGVQGVRIINVADPQSPFEAGNLSAPSATALFVVDNIVYLADDADGAYVIAHNLTGVDEYEQQNLVNMMLECSSIFNAGKGIGFNLNLAEHAAVKIDLFDVTGRLVENIHNGYLDRGTSNFQCSKKVSSGVYFLAIDGENFRISRKLLVVK